MDARLVVQPECAEAGKVYPLHSGRTVTIGRNRENDIVIPDLTTSGWHLQLEDRGDGWWLKDLNSRNGTDVNGQRFDEGFLAHGDVLLVGDTNLRLELEGMPEPPALAARPAADAGSPSAADGSADPGTACSAGRITGHRVLILASAAGLIFLAWSIWSGRSNLTPKKSRPGEPGGLSPAAQVTKSLDAGSAIPVASTGSWRTAGGVLAQIGTMSEAACTFGSPAWTDCEFSLEARKDGGSEGFLILFRAQDPQNLYGFNFGSLNNRKFGLERRAGGAKRLLGPLQPGVIEPGRWYAIRVRCEGRRLQVWLDGKPVCDFEDASAEAHAGGRVGVGTWNTTASFRNLSVRSLQGAVLFSGLPELRPADAAKPAKSRPAKPGSAAVPTSFSGREPQ